MSAPIALQPSAAQTIPARPRLTACAYIPPQNTLPDYGFFTHLIEQAKDPARTFEDIRGLVEENKAYCYQFHLKFVVPSEKRDNFAKVLLISAQEANRFVSSVDSSTFIEPTHLGFSRTLTSGVDNPSATELVLVDRDANALIFIEESIVDKQGTSPGRYVAVNRLVEEAGHTCFEGFYLYPEGLAPSTICESIMMLNEVKKRMLAFADDNSLDAVYDQLKPF